MDKQDQAAEASKPEDDASICFICDQLNTDKSRIIGARGIETLLNSSKRRKDRKHIWIQDQQSITCHEKCQKSYNRDSSIASVEKARHEKNVKTREINKRARKFNFALACLFCEKEEDKKDSRKHMCHVKSDNTRERILETLETRPNNEFNKNLKARLTITTDLVKANACYHNTCMTDFYTNGHANLSQRQTDEDTLIAINFIKDYLKEHATDCQISYAQLKDEYTGVMPDVDTVRKELTKRFRDNLFLHTTAGDLIICTREALDNILIENWKEKCVTEEEKKNRTIDSASEIIRRDITSQLPDETAQPESLERFMSNLDSKDNVESDPSENECVSIANKRPRL